MHDRYQMRIYQNGTKHIFSGYFYAPGLAHEDCNAVPERESKNFLIFIWAVQIKNQTVRWVAKTLDAKAVFPKENELVEVSS